MNLNKLLYNIEYKCDNFSNIDITSIEHDSRKIESGSLYICLKGLTVDGHDYAVAACDSGASCIITEKLIEGLDAMQIIVEDSRAAYALIASNWYDNPHKELKIIAVTGTNGKTTTAHIIGKLLNGAGIETAVLGSLGAFIKGKVYNQKLNTPDPMDFHKRLRFAADEGCECVVMETSAHGLYLKKTEPVKFVAGVFTNLTQDHLDDFGTMDKYKKAKKILFQDNKCDVAIINSNDSEYQSIIDEYNGKVIYYGSNTNANVKAEDIVCSLNGSSFTLTVDNENYDINLKLPGKFNVFNSLAAISVCKTLGVELNKIIGILEEISVIDGRMESVDCGQDYLVLVDYAHTPDSLENVLKAARGFSEERVISVFGCGGDRDAKKRPIMGSISSECADYSIITSDNPRTEEPDSIIDMIEKGMKTKEYVRITDRRLAINKSLEIAKKGDVVVIAGKGHETYQDVMGKKHHFDDREVVREYFKDKSL